MTIRNADLVITINKKQTEFTYSLGARKDSTILIDAEINMASYKQKYPKYKILVVGDGDA